MASKYPRRNPVELPLLAKVRQFCLSLPEVTETTAWGHPNFLAGKKTFLTFEAHDGVPSIAFRLSAADIERLEHAPGFSLTPYGRGAWISMTATGRRGWQQVQELVRKSYGTVALERMRIALQSRASTGRSSVLLDANRGKKRNQP